MLEKLRNVFIGNPGIGGRANEDHLLSKSQALAMLSSDALSSIAYGPEQVILVLTSISAAAIWWSLPIGLSFGTVSKFDNFLSTSYSLT